MDGQGPWRDIRRVDTSGNHANFIEIIAYPGNFTAVFLGCRPNFAGMRVHDVDAPAKRCKTHAVGFSDVILIGITGIIDDGTGRPVSTLFNYIRRDLHNTVSLEAFNVTTPAVKYFQGFFIHHFNTGILKDLQSGIVNGIQLVSGKCP
jgi:hypothetical protein